jgi:hypothetical protein
MAEKMVRVCDVCGEPAEETVTFRLGNRSLAQDLCATHVRELVRNSHAPKRGRRPGAGRSAAASASAKATATPSGGRRARGRKKSTAKAAKRTRRPITDPVLLEKRRAALAKAREARAAKRAAARGG